MLANNNIAVYLALVRWYNAGALKSYVNASTGSYVVFSDRTKKIGITPITNDEQCCKDVDCFQVYKYYSKDDHQKRSPMIGVMADELLENPTLRDCVQCEKNPKNGDKEELFVDYQQLAMRCISVLRERTKQHAQAIATATQKIQTLQENLE